MTGPQVRDWYFDGILPTGPICPHRWEHTETAGGTLGDSVGDADGTIGAATWVALKPTQNRVAVSTARDVAAVREPIS